MSKAYLITSDTCPPCQVLKDREKPLIDEIAPEILTIENEDHINKASELIKDTGLHVNGVPCLLVQEDDGSAESFVGLVDIKKKLEQMRR